MAIDFTQFEATIQTKLDAVTDEKEMLLLGKAIESTIDNITLSDIQTEGTTQVTNVTDEGDTQVARVIDEGDTQVANVQAAAGGFIADNNGSFTGTMSGEELVLSGNLTVNGTTTTINASTLDVADTNITVANGATDSASANGAGITVGGASATISYAASTDSWDFNKDIRTPNKVYFANRFDTETDLPSPGTYHGMFAHVHGTGRFYGSHAGAWYKLIHEGSTYTNLHPEVATITTDIDFNQPVNTLTMGSNVTFTESNKAEGKSCLFKLVTAGNTPTFSSNIKWAGGEEPAWAVHGYWVVSLICHDGTTVFGSATGHTV